MWPGLCHHSTSKCTPRQQPLTAEGSSVTPISRRTSSEGPPHPPTVPFRHAPPPSESLPSASPGRSASSSDESDTSTTPAGAWPCGRCRRGEVPRSLLRLLGRGCGPGLGGDGGCLACGCGLGGDGGCAGGPLLWSCGGAGGSSGGAARPCGGTGGGSDGNAGPWGVGSGGRAGSARPWGGGGGGHAGSVSHFFAGFWPAPCRCSSVFFTANGMALKGTAAGGAAEGACRCAHGARCSSPAGRSTTARGACWCPWAARCCIPTGRGTFRTRASQSACNWRRRSQSTCCGAASSTSQAG
mmetsp:Transcript_129551/g.360957  ORF Transcript_129551/g.360957 Transcript_129551/m.360957 type:complete len:298 (+) Transcript_129551:90-983(+)